MADPQVESFLYQEALFMDEHRFDEWLSLWGDPARYWVPCNADDIDPLRQVSIIYDDRERLVQRIERLKSGSVQAMNPKPRMRVVRASSFKFLAVTMRRMPFGISVATARYRGSSSSIAA